MTHGRNHHRKPCQHLKEYRANPKHTRYPNRLFAVSVLIFCPEFRHRRIWHVDQEGRVATPIDFTATLSYVNFLNHSDQARATTCLLYIALCLLLTAYCLLRGAYCLI